MKQYQQNNPSSIQDLFNSIAEQYDVTNSIMSFHIHALWNRALVRNVIEYIRPIPAPVLLDLCAGTGEIAFRIASIKPLIPKEIHLLDFSEKMLAVAKKRHQDFPEEVKKCFYFHQADAQQLPFQDHTFDVITLAYGLRNLQIPEKCLEECYRTLKPDRALFIIELTRPTHPFIMPFHYFFLRFVVPFIGKLITRNKEAYQYLRKSILTFVPPEEILCKAQKIGFRKTEAHPLFGGSITMYRFEK